MKAPGAAMTAHPLHRFDPKPLSALTILLNGYKIELVQRA
jgi:hypothetical protein